MTTRTNGRRGARESHEPRLLVHQFLRQNVADAIPQWDGTSGVTEWGMDGNDSLSCCGPAATDHLNVALAGVSRIGTLGLPTFTPGVVGAYYAYGEAMGEGPNADQGVDNASWLGFLYKNGIIDGYVEIPVTSALAMASTFKGLLVAQSLSDNAESEFDQHIAWGQPGDVPDGNEGHDTLLIATNPDGSGVMVTWGALQAFTPDYFPTFVTDCWAIIDKDDPNVDWTALQAALDAVHGAVGAFPADPVPVTPPTPSATPQGRLASIKAEIERIASELGDDAEAMSGPVESAIGVIESVLGLLAQIR